MATGTTDLFCLTRDNELLSRLALGAAASPYRLVPLDPDAPIQASVGEPASAMVLDFESLGEQGPTALAEFRACPSPVGAPVIVLVPSDQPAAVEQAYALGADEVLAKDFGWPTLVQAIQQAGRFQLYFWGVRGTLPVSGRRYLKYGGNTSSIGLMMGHQRQFVFDAGTGLRNLSRYLMSQHDGQFDGRLFFTHPHWDHLNCLPFFQPLFRPQNRISLMGPPQGELSFRSLIEGQMNGIYFPIRPDSFQADVRIDDIEAGEHCFDGISLKALRLDHPGHCLGYRVDYAGASLAYITDNELGERASDDAYLARLAEFLHGVTVLIHDTSYFDDEYPQRERWGHSSVSQAVRLAARSGARTLFLFHHDPGHSDRDIDHKLTVARQCMDDIGATFDCHNAREGEVWDLRTLQKLKTIR